MYDTEYITPELHEGGDWVVQFKLNICQDVVDRYRGT